MHKDLHFNIYYETFDTTTFPLSFLFFYPKISFSLSYNFACILIIHNFATEV